MKKNFFFFVLALVFFGAFNHNVAAATNDSTVATEWIAVKESSIDSVTLSYFQQKGLISYTVPKEENNNVFVNVVSYLARLLDSSLSSVSKKANEFYNTPIGFWTVWGIFYYYTGGEILGYLLILLYLIFITVLFVWLWRKNCIHRPVPIEQVGQIDVQSKTDIVEYEVKHSNVAMQFWLLLIYLVMFLIGACVL